MGSDRARISYDPERGYHAVVAQQGRVTVEADWNEASQISGELARESTLDIVGSRGTPDEGYKVGPTTTPAGLFDFEVGAGTMYVGGMRVALDEPVQYAEQEEWL